MKRLLLILFVTSSVVSGEQPMKLHPDADTWNLTSYLKGTPAQIRRTLYGDIVRLNRGLRETSIELDEAKADLATDRAVCLKRCHERPDYKAAKSDRDAAERDLAAARNGGTPQDRLAASGRFNRAKAITDRLAANALADDRNMAGDQRRIDVDTSRLADQQESLTKAIEWKDQLLAACANSLRLEWPLDEGAKGFLGTVKVRDVTDGAIVADYAADEVVSQSDAGEGLANVTVHRHVVRILASFEGANDCHRGSSVLLNRTFVVVSEKTIGDEEYYLLHSTPSDQDALWRAITSPVGERELLEPATKPAKR